MMRKPHTALLFGLALCLSLGLSLSLSAQTPLRVISTNAATTELMSALGLADTLIAVDVTSDNPQGLPNIGYHRNLSAEGLLALQPSHVLGGSHLGPASVIPALRSAQVNVVQLPDAFTLSALDQNIAQLATALGVDAQGKALRQQVQHQYQALRPEQLKGKRMALLLAMDLSKLRLAGQETHGDALIQLLGARNVAEFINYQSVSAESLLAMRPDVLLVTGREDGIVDALLARYPVLRLSNASVNGHILQVDGRALIAGLSLQTLTEAKRLQDALSTPALAAQRP